MLLTALPECRRPASTRQSTRCLGSRAGTVPSGCVGLTAGVLLTLSRKTGAGTGLTLDNKKQVILLVLTDP